jgi:hypothetical protein
MDRNIVYPGAIPLDTDLLNTNRNAMVALGALIGATLGKTTVVDGLTVTPASPAALAVVVGPGSITQLSPVDQNGYGSLPADVVDSVMKMGVTLSATSFTLSAPMVSGQSVNYLIQAAFSEADVSPVVLPYYNAANPAQPFLGPANSGAPQATLRQQSVQLQLKAGAGGITGTQATPPVDSGWIGLAVVTVNYGQTQILAANIALMPTNAMLPYKLPDLRPGFANMQAFSSSGSFIVPSGVSRVRVKVIGGGGAGGTHASLPGGGGGAGGQAVSIISGLVAGSSIPVTVGAAGIGPASPGNGGNGGTSSFGVFVSATGGMGGIGGTAAADPAGTIGGIGVGGMVNYAGSWGTDAISLFTRGGDGGGPGSGRGSTGLNPGMAATGWGGGGGGGGGSSAPDGTGTGGPGGNGGSGIVIVEY